MEKEITVIIACMDPRLNERLNELSGRDDVLILRNAGANVNGLRKSLQSVIDSGIGIKAIVSMQHNDCAANKFIKSIIDKERPEPSKILMDSLVRQFIRSDVDLANIDQTNHDMQIDSLQKLVEGKIKVRDGYATVHIPTPHNSHEHKEHTVVAIIGRSHVPYECIAEALHKELKSIYIIQAIHAKDVHPDLELAKTLFNLKHIVIPKLETHRDLHNETAREVSKAFGIDVEMVNLTQNCVKSRSKH